MIHHMRLTMETETEPTGEQAERLVAAVHAAARKVLGPGNPVDIITDRSTHRSIAGGRAKP